MDIAITYYNRTPARPGTIAALDGGRVFEAHAFEQPEIDWANPRAQLRSDAIDRVLALGFTSGGSGRISQAGDVWQVRHTGCQRIHHFAS